MDKQALNKMEMMLRAGKISPKNITRMLGHYLGKPGKAIPAVAELMGKGERLKKVEPYLRGAARGGEAAMELAGPERVGKLLTSKPGLQAMRALRTPGIPREAPLIAQQHPELYHALARIPKETTRPISFKQVARQPLERQYGEAGGMMGQLKPMQAQTLLYTALHPEMPESLAGFMLPGIVGRPVIYARGPGTQRHEMAHYMTGKYPMGYNIRATKHILDTLRKTFPKSEFGAGERSLAGRFGPQGQDIAQLGGLAESLTQKLTRGAGAGEQDVGKFGQIAKHMALSGGTPVPVEAMAQWIATRGNPKSVQRFMKAYEGSMPREIAQSKKLDPRMKTVAEHLRRNYKMTMRAGRGKGKELVGRPQAEGKTLEKIPGLVRGVQELYPQELSLLAEYLKRLGGQAKNRLFGQ